MKRQDVNIAQGHIWPVWRPFVERVRKPARRVPAAERGRYGNCWENALIKVSTDPERFVYVEGLAVPSQGFVLADGVHAIAGRFYPHAWVFDRHIGEFVEVTDQWERLGTTYVGTKISYKRASEDPYESTLENEWIVKHNADSKMVLRHLT